MNKLLTIADLQEAARRRVPKLFYDFVDGGSWTECTYRSNEADFAGLHLRQRVMVDISERRLASAMAGQGVSMPVGIAPTGLAGMIHADGEILVAQAAEDAGVPFTLSTTSICSIEDIRSSTKAPFWFQLYVMRDRGFVRDLIARAKAAGCPVLVLTVDLPTMGQRHRDLRNGLSAPPRLTPRHLWQMANRPRWCLGMLRTRRRSFGNVVGHAEGLKDISAIGAWTASQIDPQLTWSSVEWIRSQWDGKLIIKGILDAEDATTAAEIGADAIIVSNHGGRQLDGAPSTIRALPGVVEAVAGRAEVHLDGGIRSGQDVLKALCLGANGVYIGRPMLYGLGAGGRAGVTRVLEILRKEIDLTMAFCGITDLREVSHRNLFHGLQADSAS